MLKSEQEIGHDILSCRVLPLDEQLTDGFDNLQQVHLVDVRLRPLPIARRVLVEEQADDLHHVLRREEWRLPSLLQVHVVDQSLDADWRGEREHGVDEVLVVAAVELVNSELTRR